MAYYARKNGVTSRLNAPGSGGSGSGGGYETIEDADGTALTQRDTVQFVGVYSEDDPTNHKTKVNIIREMTKAQMDALSTDAKKGVIHTTDEPDNPANPISAEDVSYGSGTVKDTLDDLTANNGAVGVDLSPYSTSSNKYTFPSDGYIVESIGAQNSGKCIVTIYGANGAPIAGLCLNAVFNYQSSSVFVRKGMSCYVFSRDSNVTVEFRGLT